MKPIRLNSPSTPSVAKKRANKYGNHPTGGHSSRKEHRRAITLRILQRAGRITNLREQVPFDLIPAQWTDKDTNGKTVRTLIERPCRYIADFVYTDSQGNTVVEDTKGVRTKEYIIKRKLMLWIHGIRISEI